uniref:TIL domain-containing protein n=1 Tax=Anopheles minimus TaxID=112268 RepID=A0A182VXC2_9DIPT
MKICVALLLLVVAVVLNEVHGQNVLVEPCLAWMKPQPICPANERYTCCKCEEATCRTRRILLKCVLPCKGGCMCKNGYVRATAGPLCPTNEEFTSCKTCFEETCRVRYIPAKCAAPCSSGCICKSGYIRATKKGKCIKIKSCKRNPSLNNAVFVPLTNVIHAANLATSQYVVENSSV